MDEKVKNIVFVDDDEIIGMVTKRLLEHMGVVGEVTVFSDSLKAIQFLKEKYRPLPGSQPYQIPDLIFLDIDMPGFGGFEILYILKELKRTGKIDLNNTRFAIVTSHKTESKVSLASKYDVMAVFEKPLRQRDIEELIRMIR